MGDLTLILSRSASRAKTTALGDAGDWTTATAHNTVGRPVIIADGHRAVWSTGTVWNGLSGIPTDRLTEILEAP